MTKQNKELLDKVYDMLTKQRFYDFYNGDFQEHIEGPKDEVPSEKRIKEQLAVMLGLNT